MITWRAEELISSAPRLIGFCMFVTHCHLNYLDDPGEKIVSAGESGVGAILHSANKIDFEVVGPRRGFPSLV